MDSKTRKKAHMDGTSSDMWGYNRTAAAGAAARYLAEGFRVRHVHALGALFRAERQVALPGAERVCFPATGGFGSSVTEWGNLPVRLTDGGLAVWELSDGARRL